MERSPGESSAFVVAAVLVTIVVLSGIMIAFVYIFPSRPASSTTTQSGPAEVRVFGIVSTTGAGTHPASMVFTGTGSSSSFVAPVTNGSYSVQLPNGETYNVTVRWAGNYSWQSGEVQRGSLQVFASAGSMGAISFNDVAPTPDSVIAVTGSLAWQAVSSVPVCVRFSTSGGENFTSTVAPDKTFGLMLPNMMTYEVHIQSQDATGNLDWYYAHQLGVSAGLSVVGVTVKIGS